jgi:hypothetical protein
MIRQQVQVASEGEWAISLEYREFGDPLFRLWLHGVRQSPSTGRLFRYAPIDPETLPERVDGMKRQMAFAVSGWHTADDLATATAMLGLYEPAIHRAAIQLYKWVRTHGLPTERPA